MRIKIEKTPSSDVKYSMEQFLKSAKTKVP